MSKTDKKRLFKLMNIIIFFSVFYGFFKNIDAYKRPQVAVQGKVDLNVWDRNSDLYLDGDYEFYPGVFISSSEIASGNYESRKFIKVPGNWNVGFDDFGAKGFGTYRLLIDNVDGESYGLSIKRIRSAYTLFINDIKTVTSGVLADREDKSVPESRFVTVPVNSKDNKIEIIIHVSNFELKEAGIVSSIKFNYKDKIFNKHTQQLLLEMFVIGIIISIGTYFLRTWILIRKESYLLNIFFVAISLGAYISVNDGQTLSFVFRYNQIFRLQLIIFSLVMISINSNLLVKKLYLYDKGKFGVFNWLLVLVAMYLPVISYASGTTRAYVVQIIIFISLTLSIVDTFYLLTVHRKNNQDLLYSTLTLINLISLLFSSIILKVIFGFDIANITIFLMLGIIILFANIANYIYSKSYVLGLKYAYQNEILTQQKDRYLNKLNNNIKKIVLEMNTLINDIVIGRYGKTNYSQNDVLLDTYHKSQHLLLLLEEASSSSFNDHNFFIQDLEKVSLKDVINDAIICVKDLIDEKSIDFNSSSIDETIFVMANYENLKLVFYHLFSNAIESMNTGTITIEARTFKNEAIIYVNDEGIGINKSNLKHIFNPFFSKTNSVGIGLPLVKNILTSIDGIIDITSVKNGGSNVLIKLKIAEPARTTLPITSKVNKLKYSVLYITTEQIQSEINWLKSAVDNLYVAFKKDEIFEILASSRIDIILLDEKLKGIDEQFLIADIKEVYSSLEIALIKMISHPQRMNLIRNDNEIDDFVDKPLTFEKLEASFIKVEKIQAALIASIDREFQYYYSQISPHFLFNTINSIIGLSYEDSEKTREALMGLSIYLRSKLESFKENKFIELEEEVELMLAYLNIIKLRNDDYFILETEIDDDLGALIPPLTLQTIVENVFKHAFVNFNKENILKIKIKKEKDFTRIVIEDNGVGINKEKLSDIKELKTNTLGLTTVIKRFKLYPHSSFNIESFKGCGSVVTIKLPNNYVYGDKEVV